jgi:hypothetical protein
MQTVTTQKDDDLKDYSYLAQRTGMKESTLRYWKLIGKIMPDSYMGRKPMWYKSTVDRYVAEGIS